MLFTCIKSWFFRNHLASFHQISHWSFCWNVIDSLFKWSCSIDCQAHIFFFKTKNCSNDDIFISCDDRIGKTLHNICMSAMAMSLRWANRGPWAFCFFSVIWHLIFMTRCLLRIQNRHKPDSGIENSNVKIKYVCSYGFVSVVPFYIHVLSAINLGSPAKSQVQLPLEVEMEVEFSLRL